MAHAIDEPIIEGFICPNCMALFRSAEVLRIHFSKEHSSTVDTDSSKSSHATSRLAPDGISCAFFDQGIVNQPFGVCRSLTSELKELRSCCVIRSTSETNALLIRLEKLICIPPLNKTERREAEQSVVPWIDVKVELCPSCGSRFGLGVEESFPQHNQMKWLLDANDLESNDRERSISLLSKRALITISNALLDYNPVFRRRHHCRLCGHVICADCSYFLDRQAAVRLMKAVDGHNLNRHPSSWQEFDSHGSTISRDELSLFVRDFNSASPLLDFDRDPTLASYWRVCKVCKAIIEKKAERLVKKYHVSPVVQIHADLRNLMSKINESMPGYTTIANSLHSGEQRYDLEMAKAMRHELLEWLQQIDCLRKQLEQLEASEMPNKSPAFIRLVRAISTMARQFLQNNLPPLRILPTSKQYGSLAVQRQCDLATRWAEEERTIAELESCLISSNKNSPKDSIPLVKPTPKQVTLEDLSRLATRIDNASGRLMSAKRSGNHSQVVAWTQQLHRLEKEFQTVSQLLQPRK